MDDAWCSKCTQHGRERRMKIELVNGLNMEIYISMESVNVSYLCVALCVYVS